MAPRIKSETIRNRNKRERRAAIKNNEAEPTAGEIQTLLKNQERSAAYNAKQRRKREKEKKRAQKRKKSLNEKFPSSEETLVLHRVALPNEDGNSLAVASRPTSTTLIDEDDNSSFSSMPINGLQEINLDYFSCNEEATTELIETCTDSLLTDILIPKRIHSDPPKDSSKNIEEDNILPKQDNVTVTEARRDGTTTGRKRTKAPPSLLSPRTIQQSTEVISDSPCVRIDNILPKEDNVTVPEARRDGTTTGRKRTKAPPSLLSPRTIRQNTEVISDSPCVRIDKRQTVQLSLIDPTT